MTTISQLISDISATGARFVISESGVGLDRPIPADLLTLAKQHRAAIRDYLIRQQEADRQRGIRMLANAAKGLPVNLQELTDFFADDLEDFGNGTVSPAGIRKACEWFAYAHKGRAAPC
jgi:hypothetical protein